MAEIFAMVACFASANLADNRSTIINPSDIFRTANDCETALQNDSRYRRDRLAPNIELICMKKPGWTWQSVE